MDNKNYKSSFGLILPRVLKYDPTYYILDKKQKPSLFGIINKSPIPFYNYVNKGTSSNKEQFKEYKLPLYKNLYNNMYTSDSIYPIKNINKEKDNSLNEIKRLLLTNEPVRNNEFTNIYIKYRYYLDEALIKTKILDGEFYKVKIYNGKLYLQNEYSKTIPIEQDNDVYMFLDFLIKVDFDVNYKPNRESTFSRLDRLILEWNLKKFSFDFSNLNKRIKQIGKNLDSIIIK
jgi:hypothetical protein